MEGRIIFEDLQSYLERLDQIPIVKYLRLHNADLLISTEKLRYTFILFIFEFDGQIYSMDDMELFAIRADYFMNNSLEEISDLIRASLLCTFYENQEISDLIHNAPIFGKGLMIFSDTDK